MQVRGCWVIQYYEEEKIELMLVEKYIALLKMTDFDEIVRH